MDKVNKRKIYDSRKLWAKNYALQTRAWLYDYKKTLVCERCGFTGYPEAIDFHHKDPSTKKYTIAEGIGRRSIKTLLTEIAKCAVLCANCHRIKHAEEKRGEDSN